MAVTKGSDLKKVDDWNMKVRVDNEVLVEQLCDITFSDNIIIYRDGQTQQATHWEVIFDKVFAPDVRKWIKGLG